MCISFGIGNGADTAIWQNSDSNTLVDFEIFVFFKSLRERRTCVGGGEMEVGSFNFSPLDCPDIIECSRAESIALYVQERSSSAYNRPG